MYTDIAITEYIGENEALISPRLTATRDYEIKAQFFPLPENWTRSLPLSLNDSSCHRPS